MKSTLRISLLLSLISISSCQKKVNTPTNLLNEFQYRENLTAIDSFSLNMLPPFRLSSFILTDNMWVFRGTQSSHFLFIYDLLNRKSHLKVPVGNGPNESIAIALIESYKEGNILFIDWNKKQLFSFTSSTIRNDSNCVQEQIYDLSNSEKTLISHGIDLKDYIVGTGEIETGRFLIIDKKTREITEQGSFPPDPEIEKLNYKQRGVLFSINYLSPHPSKNRFATVISGLFDISEINNDGKLTSIHSKSFFFPKYILSKEYGPIVFRDKKSKVGYTGISSNEKYIYTLYSDLSAEDTGSWESAYTVSTILVYDWNGKPIKHFELSKRVSAITVKHNILYGFSEMGEEPMVYAYNLNL